MEIQRSTFLRNRNFKTTFNSGYLVPFLVDEVLPGDTFNLQATLLASCDASCRSWTTCTSILIFSSFPIAWSGSTGSSSRVSRLLRRTLSIIWSSGVGAGRHRLDRRILGDYFGIPTGFAGIKANASFRFAGITWCTRVVPRPESSGCGSSERRGYYRRSHRLPFVGAVSATIISLLVSPGRRKARRSLSLFGALPL